MSGNGVKLVVAGSGGNIGSHLVPHLARMERVTEIVLIDPDRYEAANIGAQDIRRSDLGKQKVRVQANRLKLIKPEIEVGPLARHVQDVPLGVFRSTAIISCLDSRVARQWVNEAAVFLGVPLVDTGVEAGSLLARATVYLPGRACMECAWDDRDYANLEQAYPCHMSASGKGSDAPPTGAPSALGALAASLGAIECQKLIEEVTPADGDAYEIVVDARHRRHYVTRFLRNDRCRLDHAQGAIHKLEEGPEILTLKTLMSRARGFGLRDARSVRVRGKRFVERLRCPGCGIVAKRRILESALSPALMRCRVCGARRFSRGFDLVEDLKVDEIDEGRLGSPLQRLGIRSGEIIRVGSNESEVYFEIG